MAAGSSNLEWLHALTALTNLNDLTRLDTERGAVNELTVDRDVAVNNHLPRLGLRASEARTKYQRVEAHLEQLDQVLAGQAVGATGFLEYAAKLCFANAVLSAEALLLAKTNGVVTVCLALGAAVLTRSVRTLLEVLGGLWGQRDAERTAQAGLAAGTCFVRHDFLSVFST
ncbi:unannotated protein [freshwater metagenome]|uniref:Unannotated protein n=1 Tax=freshwater metagenome TaxID=449393 RepID=A0A6J6DGJ7_9ZZZZ